jgi:hypothetical protein
MLWFNAFRANGGFSYTEFYWEWVEDILSRNGKLIRETGLYRAIFALLFSYDRVAAVIRAFCAYWYPATNTLHTSRGEMSISLWDMDQLGGLPIAGRFYDEVVPAAEELSATSKGSQQSCRYLFLAYHKLCKEGQGQKVKITSWIRYWYRGALRYKRPPNKSQRNKRDPPPNAFNPSGKIHEIRHRTSADRAAFDDLGMEGEDIESTYLAAFLACWLCLFVFPRDDTVVDEAWYSSSYVRALLWVIGKLISLEVINQRVPPVININHVIRDNIGVFMPKLRDCRYDPPLADWKVYDFIL